MSSETAGDLPFRLQTNVEGQTLRIRSFTGEEAVSRLFRFRLLADSQVPVPTTQLLGQSVTFVFDLRQQQRTFLATVSSVGELGADEHGRWHYGLELVPRLWGLTQTVRARIFEDLDPIAIIRKVFEGNEVSAVSRIAVEDRTRPYCVQYFESDFDFVVRLLEEEGHVYHYDAAEDGKTPVFELRYFPSYSTKLGGVPFHEVAGGPDEEIVSWKKTRVLTATTVRARDHLFEAEWPLLEGSYSVPADTPIPGWEKLEAGWAAGVDRYPGNWGHLFEEVARNGGGAVSQGYADFGGSRTRHDLRQVAGSTSASEGISNCHRLAPGCLFDLTGHPTAGGEYFIVSVHHKGSQALDHSSGSQGFSYENRFTCVPWAQTMMYLPPRSTHKPVIHGCQTALVVGTTAAGEIFTDKYGRVQVQFWWDRGNERSCWVRVATSWAGSHWGVQHIPRVGQEVVVTFLDGDPDRPLIVGSVYNRQQMPPFDVPEHKTQSGIRTRSTPGGGEGECNEVRFEDLKGSEELYIQAQRDRKTIVKNDSREKVQNDRYDVVKSDFHATTVGDKREIIDGTSHLIVGEDSNNAVLGNLGIAATEIHLKAQKIVIEADSISLRTSEKSREFIYLKKRGGITIDSKGEQVWVNCGGAKEPEDGCYTDPEQATDPFPDPAPPTPPPEDDPCHLKN